VPGALPEPKPYWSFREVAEYGFAHPFTGSEDDACRQLDQLLRSAVAEQMVADVPLGAFLSGGVDSSTIVALMQAQSTRPVKTFTIGLDETDYNEAEYAKAVAKHLGTEHSELYVTPKEAMSVIPKLPTIYDEPFSDQSQIPTFVVSQLARRHVTVSLSGDAGDELFGGYNRYFGVGMWRKIERLPLGARVVLSKLLTLLPPKAWDAVLAPIPSFAKPQMLQKLVGHRLHKLADLLPARNDTVLYLKMLTYWHEMDLVYDRGPVLRTFADLQPVIPGGSLEHTMMWRDSIDYLPDDILVKVDRAGMAVCLESRIPMLNHRVVEFALRVPLSMKIRKNTGKWLLRRVLDQYVPRQLIERPKMGFGIPMGGWLRGPLRDWAENLLAEGRLQSEGWFDPKPIREKWAEHISEREDWQYHLWCILMFQAWLESTSGLVSASRQ
jgi:asparagine synthase (glutamine-hydrolysing)